jgi:branched-chain amino acid transport system permease protein
MPVYGEHLKQILVTVGGLIVIEQMIYVVWGPERDLHHFASASPAGGLRDLAEAATRERYRLLAVVIGLALFRRHASYSGAPR